MAPNHHTLKTERSRKNRGATEFLPQIGRTLYRKSNRVHSERILRKRKGPYSRVGGRSLHRALTRYTSLTDGWWTMSKQSQTSTLWLKYYRTQDQTDGVSILLQKQIILKREIPNVRMISISNSRAWLGIPTSNHW